MAKKKAAKKKKATKKKGREEKGREEALTQACRLKNGAFTSPFSYGDSGSSPSQTSTRRMMSPCRSWSTTSIPSTTRPNTVYRPSS